MFVMLCYDVVDLPDVLLMAGEYLDLFDSESDISGDVSDELVEFFWLDTCLEAEKGCTAPSLCLPENQRCLCVRKCMLASAGPGHSDSLRLHVVCCVRVTGAASVAFC